MKHVRLLPILIFCTAFTLSLKVGSLWQGVSAIAASSETSEKDAGGAPAAGEENQQSAMTDEKNAPQAGDEPAEKPRRSEQKPEIVRFDPSLVTDSELDMLQRLVERRSELKKRATQLDTRQRLLQATEKRIDGKLVELKRMQDTIDGLLRKHDEQKEAQMRSVVKIYESMKPKDAARIFEQLDMAILLDVVERMREAKTAPIMANMTPGKAKSMTAALAQRRALPSPDTPGKRKN